MTFEDYWEVLCKVTPSLRCGDMYMRMSVSEFQRVLLGTFKAGRQSAQDTQKASKEFGTLGKPEIGNIADLFGGIFGK